MNLLTLLTSIIGRATVRPRPSSSDEDTGFPSLSGSGSGSGSGSNGVSGAGAWISLADSTSPSATQATTVTQPTAGGGLKPSGSTVAVAQSNGAELVGSMERSMGPVVIMGVSISLLLV
jgi:hypothetical protein